MRLKPTNGMTPKLTYDDLLKENKRLKKENRELFEKACALSSRMKAVAKDFENFLDERAFEYVGTELKL